MEYLKHLLYLQNHPNVCKHTMQWAYGLSQFAKCFAKLGWNFRWEKHDDCNSVSAIVTNAMKLVHKDLIPSCQVNINGKNKTLGPGVIGRRNHF